MIPCNKIKWLQVVLLGDIDGDGLIEMVIALTDRVVRSYRWYESDQLSSSAETKQSSVNESFKSGKNQTCVITFILFTFRLI